MAMVALLCMAELGYKTRQPVLTPQNMAWLRVNEQQTLEIGGESNFLKGNMSSLNGQSLPLFFLYFLFFLFLSLLLFLYFF